MTGWWTNGTLVDLWQTELTRVFVFHRVLDFTGQLHDPYSSLKKQTICSRKLVHSKITYIQGVLFSEETKLDREIGG